MWSPSQHPWEPADYGSACKGINEVCKCKYAEVKASQSWWSFQKKSWSSVVILKGKILWQSEKSQKVSEFEKWKVLKIISKNCVQITNYEVQNLKLLTQHFRIIICFLVNDIWLPGNKLTPRVSCAQCVKAVEMKGFWWIMINNTDFFLLTNKKSLKFCFPSIDAFSKLS